MRRVKPYFVLSGCLVIALFGLLIGLAYFAFTSPELPFRYNLFQIDKIGAPGGAGDLQPGDIITTFDGKHFVGCWYFVESPVYFAPRQAPVEIQYWRPGAGVEGGIVSLPSLVFRFAEQRASGQGRGVTAIRLTDLSQAGVTSWISIYALVFTCALLGAIIILGGAPKLENFLLGLSFFAHGLLLAAGTAMGHAQAPLSLFVWAIGLPAWGMLQVAAHAIWPVRQFDRPAVRLMIAAVAVNGALHLSSLLAGAAGLGCYQTAWPVIVCLVTYLLGLSLPVGGGIYLLQSAYRLNGNPFSRLQIRAIAWAVILSSLSIFSFTIPTALGLNRIAPFDVTILFGGLVPLTYFFAIYHGNLLSVDRYLHRLLFIFFFIAVWAMVTYLVVASIDYWIPDPDPLLVALAAAIPPLLLSTFVRDRLGMLVDLALYGTHYDYETVVSQIGLTLASVLTETELLEVAIEQIPQALSISGAALWLAEADGKMRLAGHSRLPAGPVKPLSEFPAGERRVEALGAPLQLAGDSSRWQVIVRLHVEDRVAGLLLLGEKFREAAYSERDIRTLQTLANWLATTLANFHYLARQREAAARERGLMSALVENEARVRAEVAGELHDRGISALGVARLMVKQARSPEVVSATLERVIADLRELSYSRLNPVGLEQGLSQALTEMVERQRALGLPVSLQAADPLLEEDGLSSPVRRELFYLAQEAVVNALKHARASRIVIALSRQPGGLQLSVCDDGQGFEVEALRMGRDGRGLGIMEARTNRIGARLSIHSTPGRGSEVVVVVKLNPG